MNTTKLLEAGFKWEGEEPSLHRDRPKVMGFMWEGKGVLVKNSIKIHLEAWHHGGDSTPSLDEALTIKGIVDKKGFYDTYWHAFITHTEIWIHRGGWFTKSVIESNIWARLGGRKNYNWQRSEPVDPAILTELGFVKVV